MLEREHVLNVGTHVSTVEVPFTIPSLEVEVVKFNYVLTHIYIVNEKRRRRYDQSMYIKRVENKRQ